MLHFLKDMNINWELVAEDILEVLPYLLPSLAAAVILFAVILGIRFLIKREPFPFPILFFLFLWNIGMMGYISLLCRESGSRDNIDLTLFAFLERGQMAVAFAVENVLFFIPFGFLMTGMLQKSGRRFAFLKSSISGFLVSVLIETIQMITKRGFVQAEDVMLNTIGAMIGSMIMILVHTILLAVKMFCGTIGNKRKKKLPCQRKQ